MSFLRGNTDSRSSLVLRIAALAVLTVAAVFLPAAAHADTFINYTVDGTFASGGTLSGTFTIDVTPDDSTTYSSNSVTYISQASIVADGVTFTCPDASAGGCIVYNSYDGWTEYGFYSATDPSQYVYLEWPIDSSTDSFSFLTGPGGSYCAGCAPGVDQDFLVSGEAVDPPPTSTPEPATPLMLLAGLAGLGFLGLRRRSIVLAS